jgi:hypothetical protein
MRACPRCGSSDHLRPFTRSDRVFLLTMLMPRVRWRFCRRCARNFLYLRPRTEPARRWRDPEPVVPDQPPMRARPSGAADRPR